MPKHPTYLYKYPMYLEQGSKQGPGRLEKARLGKATIPSVARESERLAQTFPISPISRGLGMASTPPPEPSWVSDEGCRLMPSPLQVQVLTLFSTVALTSPEFSHSYFICRMCTEFKTSKAPRTRCYSRPMGAGLSSQGGGGWLAVQAA
jgi:hypothetical protein